MQKEVLQNSTVFTSKKFVHNVHRIWGFMVALYMHNFMHINSEASPTEFNSADFQYIADLKHKILCMTTQNSLSHIKLSVPHPSKLEPNPMNDSLEASAIRVN